MLENLSENTVVKEVERMTHSDNAEDIFMGRLTSVIGDLVFDFSVVDIKMVESSCEIVVKLLSLILDCMIIIEGRKLKLKTLSWLFNSKWMITISQLNFIVLASDIENSDRCCPSHS